MLRALRSTRVATAAGIVPATLWLAEGRIERVASYEDVPRQDAWEDFGTALISPGAVDAHVHINEPGRADWEGFETATKAALAGGITTLVDMPLNSEPVTTTMAAWERKLAAGAGQLYCHCGFYAGLVPGNVDQLETLLAAGALGVKAFLVHSGLDEFPAAGEAELRAAMPILARLGVPLLVHAELDGPGALLDPNSRSYADYLATRPADWELRAIAWMIDLCREYRCAVHIVHLATAEALPLLRAARAEGLPLTVETAPHYLTFCSEEIEDGATQYKCAPPIRAAANREGLWQGLRDGTIDFVSSDHSPCPPGLKNLDSGIFARAWGGIASLQWTVANLWTQARRRGFSLEDVLRWTSGAPARFLRLEGRKGCIIAGADADLAVWQPEVVFEVTSESIAHRHKVSPYLGRQLEGAVLATILAGNVAYRSGDYAPAGGHIILNTSMDNLVRLNFLDESAAFEELQRCCGATAWVQNLLAARPFGSVELLFATSDAAFEHLAKEDWLEAFDHHPKIGDVESLRKKFASTAQWAGNEQAGAASATEAVLSQLAAGNAAYEERFGFIFIICATGKSAADMLTALQARLGYDAEAELKIAAGEQKKITRLRLGKLLDL